MATMKGKRIMTSLYIEPETHAALKELSEKSRIPIAVYLREAVEDVLAKYKVKVRGSAKK